MKFKKLFRAGCLCLLSSVLVLSSVGCKPGNNGDPSDPEEKPEINYEVEIGDLVSDRKSDYTIVVPEDYSECIMYAAEEFQSLLAQSTGVYLPIRTESQILYDADKKIISLGNTEILNTYPHEFDYESLNGDGFYIKTFDHSMFINGALDRGTLYGVYEYLERLLGVRFFATDCTYIPQHDAVKLYEMSIKEVPAFRYRAALERSVFRADADRVFYARTRQSHEFIDVDEKYGGQIKWFRGIEVSHNTMEYVPIEKYYLTPEQKEQNKDMYTFNGETPYDICYTNGLLPDGSVDPSKSVSTIKAAIESLKSFIQEDPDAEFYPFGQMDFKTACVCPTCQESIRQYGQSGTIIRFANTMMREVQKWLDSSEYQGKVLKVVVFSYLYSSDAPVEFNAETGKYEPLDPSVVPDPNMWIRLTPFDADRYCSPGDPMQTNKKFQNYIAQWDAICDNFMAWAYSAQYSHYFVYNPTVQKIQNEFREFRDGGTQYMLEQLCTTERNNAQSIMDLYVQSKMLWDPEQDPYALRKEFVSYYYGPAAEQIQYSLEFMDEYYYQNQLKTNGRFFTYDQTNALYHPIEYLEHVYDKAQEGIDRIRSADLTDAEKQTFETRVKRFKLIPLYMMMINRNIYYRDNAFRYNEVAKEFFEICEELNVEEYGETFSIESLRAQFPYSK